MDNKKNEKFDESKFFGSNMSRFVALSEELMDLTEKSGGINKVIGRALFSTIDSIKNHTKPGCFMREEGLKHLKSLTTIAKHDVTLLNYFQKILIQMEAAVRNEEVIRILDTKILVALDDLIVRQASLVRKIPCPVQIKSSAVVRKEVVEDLVQYLINEMNQGNYREVVVMLLTNNQIFKPEQSKKLYDLGEKMVSIYTGEGAPFLEILKLRLFSAESRMPQKIDYSVLKNNELLEIPDIKAIQGVDILILPMLLEEATKYYDLMTEVKLKEHFNVRVVKKIDSLIELLADQRNGNHLPFLKR